MKKAILSIGLFTLVLASTSFASPKNSTSSIVEITSNDIDGGQQAGGNKKLDFNKSSSKYNKEIQLTIIDGGQQAGGNKKLD